MILPGFPMPLSMGGAAKSPPFSLSGSWEAGFEGWTLSGGVMRDTIAARTGMYGIVFYGNGYIQYVLPASQVSGLTISVSLWNLDYFEDATRSLQYRIGSGSFVNIVPNAAIPSSWTFVSGSFFSPGQEDVTIRLTATGALEYLVDDWEISGT